MKFTDRISQIFNFSKKQPAQVRLFKEKFIPQTLLRARQDVGKWRSALIAAESPLNPNRKMLYDIYNDVMLDSHLSSVINSRKIKTLGKAFKIVDAKGEEVVEKTELFNTEWFNNFVSHALDSIFWGHSLIQLGDIFEDKFVTIELVERHHVKPESKLIVNFYADQTGIDYTESPLDEWLIEVGSGIDLGLLLKASPLVLYKKSALGSYAEYTELFGAPIRLGRTNVRDEEMRKNMADMLQQMGTATWGVFDQEDKIELVESKATNGGEVYGNLISLINSELSKLVLGQTMTSDDGASRAQAEVHENVANEYAQSDCRMIEFLVNDKLIPLMNGHGFNLKGLKFKYDWSENLSVKEQFAIDSKLLDYYNIPESYILEKYGTPVEKMAPKVKPNEENTESVLNFLSRTR